MARDVDGLAQNFGTLLADNTFSDVTLVVSGHRMSAHRVVLSARSDYFKAMFTIDLTERQNKDVILNDTSPAAFQAILNYAYTGTLDVEAIDEQTLLEVLELSYRYQFPWVQKVVTAHLAKTVTINTVCERLIIAELLNIDILRKACLEPTLATELLRKRELVDKFSYPVIKSVLAFTDRQVPEIVRFQAVCGWIETHKDDDTKSLLSNIRLSLLTVDEIYSVVRPTNHYSDGDLLDAIHKRSSTTDLQSPHCLAAQAIEPQRQTFDSSAEEFIMTMRRERGDVVINTIQLTLPSHLNHYSYEVDVSSDDRCTWSTVCGHDHCEGQQTLYIAPQRVSHVRIRFSTGSVEQCTPLTVVASYSDNTLADFNAEQRCRAPKHNVATGATARLLPISKWHNKLDGLFDGNLESSALFPPNDPDKSLVIRFSQPYYVSSLVFLLHREWHCRYSYYVEVSDNKITWNRVYDKSEKKCRGWQVVRFAPQRVVYVRIVGTHARKDHFLVSHFECPIDEERLPQLLKL